jgi:hypothetical protein
MDKLCCLFLFIILTLITKGQPSSIVQTDSSIIKIWKNTNSSIITYQQKFVIFFLFLISCHNLYAQETEYNWKHDGLIGKVKKITEMKYEYENNEKKLETTNIYFYDKIGLRTKEIEITHEDSSLQTSYSFNGYHIDIIGSHKDSTIYLYDDENRLIKQKYFDVTGATFIENFTYLKNYTVQTNVLCFKNSCNTTSVNINGIKHTESFSLGYNGISNFSYGSTNENDSIYEHLYSDNSESQFYRLNKITKTGTTMEYLGTDTTNLAEYRISILDDSLENCLYSKTYSSDKKTLLKEYYATYDKGNLKEERTIDSSGRLLYKKMYLPDEEISVDLNEEGAYDTTIYRTVFTYDAEGNWIDGKYSLNKDIDMEYERIIEYYGDNDDEGYRCVFVDSMPASSYQRLRNDSLDKTLTIVPNQLQLLIKSNDYSKIKIYLINKSDSIIKYTSQDGYIPMIREAMDENGNWKPIEYWERSFCGNSYHEASFMPGKCYIMSTDLYGGDFKTKIRFKMRLGQYFLYSNSYDGRINKNQFIVPKDMNLKDFLDKKK